MESYDRDEGPTETTKLLAESEEGKGGGVDEPDRESFVSHILVKPCIVCFVEILYVFHPDLPVILHIYWGWGKVFKQNMLGLLVYS